MRLQREVEVLSYSRYFMNVTWLIIQGTGESETSGGGGGVVLFSLLHERDMSSSHLI